MTRKLIFSKTILRTTGIYNNQVIDSSITTTIYQNMGCLIFYKPEHQIDTLIIPGGSMQIIIPPHSDMPPGM